MNAKIKLVASLAAAQMMVPTLFAQPRTVVVPAPAPVYVQSPYTVEGSLYEITGRVQDITPNRILLRTHDRGSLVILRREDTRFWAQVRVGDMVSIKYNMMATDVRPVAPLVAPRHRH